MNLDKELGKPLREVFYFFIGIIGSVIGLTILTLYKIFKKFKDG